MTFYRVLLAAVLFVGLTVTTEISLRLPELKKYEYTFTPESYTVKSKQYFRQEFENALDPNVTILSENASLTNHCAFTTMTVEPRDLFQIKLNTLQGNLMGSFVTDMIVVKSQRLVYTVTNKLTVTAYSYADNELKKLVSKDLDSDLDPATANIDNAALFALTHDQSTLYLFTKRKSFVIETKTILEKIKSFAEEFSVDAESAAVMGEHIILVGPTLGLKIFRIHPDYTLQLFVHTATFQHQEMAPNSVAVDQISRLIYVLGESQNIYVFTIWNDKLEPYDVIEFQHVLNFMVKLEEDRIYYSFVDGGNMKVAELQYTAETKTASLVRYYKMFDYIYDFKVFGEELYALTQETLEIVPTNIDPRTITKQHNGLRLSMKARKLAPIAHQTFVFISQQSLKLVRLRTHNSRIQCKFLSEHSNTVHITFKANLSHCDSSPKLYYNSYCEISRTLVINVDIPQEKQRQKTLLYSVVVLVTVLFLVGLVCLIQWRNGRLDLIDKLADEIHLFRERDKQRPQPLHEENQIEVPQVVTEGEERDQKRETEDHI